MHFTEIYLNTFKNYVIHKYILALKLTSYLRVVFSTCGTSRITFISKKNVKNNFEIELININSLTRLGYRLIHFDNTFIKNLLFVIGN